MTDVMHGSRLALPVSLELRAIPPRIMAHASLPIALVLTMVLGLLLLAPFGKNPMAGPRVLLVKPLANKRTISGVLLKTAPLVLYALGLSVCYRTNMWNTGAEEQLILSGIFIAATTVYFDTPTPAIPGDFALVLTLVAGLIGGALWTAITTLLHDRFHADEILISPMLTYITQLLLLYIVNRPLKNPNGMNFPQSIVFDSALILPTLVAGMHPHVSFPFMFVMTAVMTLFASRSFTGYRPQVDSLILQAVRYVGFSPCAALWTALLVSDGPAGVVGAFEVTGPIGQLLPSISPGYGFAAIVVAFVRRLNPVGTVLGAIVMSLLYVGGGLAQLRLSLPSVIIGAFQGMLLFSLLACDTPTEYRLRWYVHH